MIRRRTGLYGRGGVRIDLHDRLGVAAGGVLDHPVVVTTPVVATVLAERVRRW
ncbi:hypothetical protein ACFY7H_29640 [Streptomyces sp. NPDC012794]|uniref:hypothetical protein n=1 Tax=Streptomyces sp. NPDC012794 TaxID=3364850 RepID=UPI0036D003D4